MSQRLAINLITCKAQPQIKPKQLIVKKNINHNVSDQSLSKDVSTFMQSNYSSNNSQKIHSVYSYLSNDMDVLQQTDQSQVILDKANDFNKSPIDQSNLQLVNQQMMTHFKKTTPGETAQPEVYANYLYYKDKIEKALCRSADNMSKYNRSSSQRKSNVRDNHSSEQITNKPQEQMPGNPFEKIRLNRFCNLRAKSQTKSIGSNRYESNKSKSQQEEVKHKTFTFSHTNSSEQNIRPLSFNMLKYQKVQHQSEAQDTLIERLLLQDKKIDMLQTDNEQLKKNYQELTLNSQKDIDILMKENLKLEGSIQEMKRQQLQFPLKEQEQMKKQFDNLTNENRNLARQVYDLELILKEVLFKTEKDRFRSGSFQNNQIVQNDSQKSTITRNRHHKSFSIDQPEDMYINQDQIFISAQLNREALHSRAHSRGHSSNILMTNLSNDISMEGKRLSSFDLSHRLEVLSSNKNISCFQESWMSASFQTHLKNEEIDPSTPMNVSLNLQLLTRLNDKKLASHHPKKSSSNYSTLKKSDQKEQQKFQMPFGVSVQKSKKKFGIKDKENTPFYN